MSEAPPPAAPVPSPAHAERLRDPVEVRDPGALPGGAPAAAASPPAEPPATPKGWAPPTGGLRSTLIFAAIAGLGALLVLYVWDLPPFSGAVQATDNAYVRAQTTVISPQVSGYANEVLVQDFQDVKQDQPLVRIDHRIYEQKAAQARAALASAQASLANFTQSQRSSAASLQGQAAAVSNARAQLTRAQADMARVNELVEQRSVSLRERDQTLAALRQAEAAVLQAEAQYRVADEQTRSVDVGRAGLEAAVANARAALALTEIDLANTEIRAPRDGRIGEVSVRQGQYVTAGTQLLFLVPPTLWIVANFKEAQTSKMQPGQPAWILVDALDGARLNGRIERIAPATGNEFAVIKPDNATGNFVKVSQRLAVRIALDPGQPLLSRLRPGMSVVARVDTAKPGQAPVFVPVAAPSQPQAASVPASGSSQ